MKKYGPQTAEIEALIERAKNLTPEQAEELSAAWVAALDTVRNAAWSAALDTVWGAARNAVLDAAWGALPGAVWDAVLDAARNAVLEGVWDTARNAVLDTARNATLALLVKDLISEEDFNILYGPWASVMEDNRTQL